MTAFPGASTAMAGIFQFSFLLLSFFFFCFSNHIVSFFLASFDQALWQWDIPFLWNGHGVPRPDDKSVCGVGNL